MASNMQDIEDQLQKQLELDVQKFNRKDFEALVDGFSEDIIYMPPGNSAVVGKEDVKGFSDKTYVTDMTVTDVKVLGMIAADDGEVAVNWGTSAILQGGNKTPAKWMHVNKRVGKDWKIMWNIFNSDVLQE